MTWDKVVRLLEKYYHQPDVEAIAICMAIQVAHGQEIPEYISDPAVWLFVVGPPSSGKTTLCIDPFVGMKGRYEVSDISVNGFITGLKGQKGILQTMQAQTGGNGILLFPDFTVILNKHPNIRSDIAGQMRRIYDGMFTKSVGTGTFVWQGKVSCIAATTPSIEDYWGVFRELGERFVMVRYKGVDPLNDKDVKGMISKAFGHQGNEGEIKDAVRRYYRLFLRNARKVSKEVLEELIEYVGVDGLVPLICLARTGVKRDLYSSARNIIGIQGASESPTRLAKELLGVAKGWVSLTGREGLEQASRLARRVAIDTIPSERWTVIRAMLENLGREDYTLKQLWIRTGIPKSTFYKTIEDMHYLKLVKIYKDGEVLDEEAVSRYRKIRFPRNIVRLLDISGLVRDYTSLFNQAKWDEEELALFGGLDDSEPEF